MRKTARERYVDYRISADIVTYLRRHKGLSLAEIGELMGVDKTFVSKVLHGEHSLTLKRLRQLEKAIRMPLPLLLLEAVKSYSIPKELNAEYEALKSVLQLSIDELKLVEERNAE